MMIDEAAPLGPGAQSGRRIVPPVKRRGGVDGLLAEYSPRFVPWYRLLADLPSSLFLSVWAGMFFGIPLQMDFGQMLGGLPVEGPRGFVLSSAAALGVNPSVLIGACVLIGRPLMRLPLASLAYARTSYRVFANRVEIEDGFWARRHTTIALSSIQSVELRRGALQQFVGLGSIRLSIVPTAADEPAVAKSLEDIPNARAAYALISGLRNEPAGQSGTARIL